MTPIWKVYVEHPSMQYLDMFKSRGWEVTSDWRKADLIQFTGGADVTPHLYSEGKHQTTSNNEVRDQREYRLFREASVQGIPMAGICRGGQFLHVMCGGKLYQHVDGHAIANGHKATVLPLKKDILVTSTHHQMMREGKGEVLMVGEEGISTRAQTDVLTHIKSSFPYRDIEAVYHQDDLTLCFQPHPEMCRKDSDCQKVYFWMLHKYLGVG